MTEEHAPENVDNIMEQLGEIDAKELISHRLDQINDKSRLIQIIEKVKKSTNPHKVSSSELTHLSSYEMLIHQH